MYHAASLYYDFVETYFADCNELSDTKGNIWKHKNGQKKRRRKSLEAVKVVLV